MDKNQSSAGQLRMMEAIDGPLIRTGRVYERYADFMEQATEQQQYEVAAFIETDTQLSDISNVAWQRILGSAFIQETKFVDGDSETSRRELSTQPVELFQTIYSSLDLAYRVDGERHEGDDERMHELALRSFRLGMHGFLQNAGLLLTDARSVRNDPAKLQQAVAQVAKKMTPQNAKDVNGALPTPPGPNDLTLYINKLMTLYITTVLSGKKTTYHNVVSTLDTGLTNYLQTLKGFSKEAFLEIGDLNLNENRTQEETDRMIELARKHPLEGAVFIKTHAQILFKQVLKSIAADNDIIAETAESMSSLVEIMLKDDLLSDEESRGAYERIVGWLEDKGWIEKDASVQVIEQAEDHDNLRPMELDWEVLPPGAAELEKGARQIIDEAVVRSGRTPEIDLTRLNILEGIRDLWGADKCYYTRGVRKKRGVVRDETGNERPDEYIILVLQELDRAGDVVFEHAIAESPIAGPNAMYVYRQDVSEHRHSWRTVMALPKNQSRQLGARNVLHTTPPEGANLNDIMIEKAYHLLTAEAGAFANLEFNGTDARGNVRVRQALSRSSMHLMD